MKKTKKQKTKNKTKDSYLFFSFCEAMGFQKKKEKIERRKKIGKKKNCILLKANVVFFFHLSADVAILTTQI